MITLDQVYLLEQKVESAVAKIQQLQAENDALNKKVEELTNALSSKSEQLTTFESDQNQIEDGIRKALERLNSIENSVLKAAQVASTPVQATPVQPIKTPVEPVITQEYKVQSAVVPSFHQMEKVQETVVETPVQTKTIFEEPKSELNISISAKEPANQDYEISESEKELGATLNPFNFETSDGPEEPEEDNPEELGFDIF